MNFVLQEVIWHPPIVSARRCKSSEFFKKFCKSSCLLLCCPLILLELPLNSVHLLQMLKVMKLCRSQCVSSSMHVLYSITKQLMCKSYSPIFKKADWHVFQITLLYNNKKSSSPEVSSTSIIMTDIWGVLCMNCHVLSVSMCVLQTHSQTDTLMALVPQSLSGVVMGVWDDAESV